MKRKILLIILSSGWIFLALFLISLERKKILKETIFSKVVKKEESLNGYTYFFEDDSNLLASVLEHVQIEKACCPFFKFDISILPFSKGFALQISGSEAALEMIKEFELSEI